MVAGHRERSRSIAELAGRQHGRLTRVQLIDLGLTPRVISTHIAAGRLHVEHRGVYALGHAAHTRRGVQIGAVLACGPGAALSHRSAAGLHALMRWDGRPHVTAARSRGTVPGVVVHRSRSLSASDVAIVDAVPVTTWARTIVDLADSLTQARVVRLLEQAAILGLYDEGELAAARRGASGRRGTERLARAVARGHHLAPQRTRSPLEERFLDLVRSSSSPLPAMTCNGTVESWGRLIEVDALFPDAGLVVELDGSRVHGHQGAAIRDGERDALLAAAGYCTLRLTWRDVVGQPDATLRRLRAALAIRRGPV